MSNTQENIYCPEAMSYTSAFCKKLTCDTSIKGKRMFEECCKFFEQLISSLETEYEKRLVTMMNKNVGDENVCNFHTEHMKIFTKNWSEYTKYIFSQYIYNLTNILFQHNENFLNNYQKIIIESLERMFKNKETLDRKMREFDGKMCLLYANYRFIIGMLVKNMVEKFDYVITQLSYKPKQIIGYQDVNLIPSANLYETG